MALKWNGDVVKLEIKKASAEGLLRAAVFFQAQHMQRLNISNPRPHTTPSQPGEYPRKRTGFGQANVMYQPASVDEIAAEGAVRIGYLQPAFYLLVLELALRRHGLLQTLKDLRPQLSMLVTATS